MNRTIFFLLMIILQISALFASTDNITSESDMNVFNSGETISSSKMNENFEILKLSKTSVFSKYDWSQYQNKRRQNKKQSRKYCK